jgi:hypothetical protein
MSRLGNFICNPFGCMATAFLAVAVVFGTAHLFGGNDSTSPQPMAAQVQNSASIHHSDSPQYYSRGKFGLSTY